MGARPEDARAVDIVIVNWNTGRQLYECVKSIYECQDSSLVRRVIVVDNGSHDDSLEGVERLGATVDRAKKNLGFGRGCNRGARAGDAPFLLFLNPDARLDDGALSACIESLNSDSTIGVCSVRLYDERGETQRSCARFPGVGTFVGEAVLARKWWPAFRGLHMSEWPHNETTHVDHVIGAFYVIRRSLFEELGGFDTRYFVYFEDLDLSRRVHDHGRRILFLADVQSFHAGGGASSQIMARRLYYSIESRLVYAFRHMGFLRAATLTAFTVVIEFPIRLLRELLRFSMRGLAQVLKAWALTAIALPAVVFGSHATYLKADVRA